jgi:D-alanyl-D-alanine carboxypeptidase
MRNTNERIIAALIILVMIFALFTITVTSLEQFPTVSARSASLYEAKGKRFVYTKNSDQRLPMASTTKIMTALVAIENYPLDKTVSIDAKACGIEGSSLYLTPGETFTMRDLIYGLMLRSANDAAEAIALSVGGSIETFASMMNAKADEIGLTKTHFTNPHGLDNPEHYTTAEELAILTAYALQNEEFKQIASTYKTVITNTDGKSRLVVNHNKLLSMYDGAIGVKTGFTKKSGRCLVGAAERDGLLFVSVTIDAPDDWDDHKKLLDYGYSVYEMRHVALPKQICYNIPVINGDKDSIRVSNSNGFSVIMKKNDPQIQTVVKLARYTAAPIKKGDALGKVFFIKDGICIGEDILCSEDNVLIKKDKKGLFSLFI